MKKLRTTIKDIAEKTGLSITTVSLVLNNKPSRIKSETKELVMRTAKEMNFQPNQLAVSLISKRTQTLGLIISDISNRFFATLARGVEDECGKNNWNVILCNSSNRHDRDLKYIQLLANKSVDGILYVMSADSDWEKAKESCALMHRLNLPFVMIDRIIEQENNYCVLLDHKLGGYLATKHLADLGHKRIGCIMGPIHLSSTVDRLDGYKRALEEAGIEYDERILYAGNYDIEGGIAGMEYLADKNVTAIFAFSDMIACGVYRQLKMCNIKIPTEISVVGYDDVLINDILEVSLTTIKQPIYEIGREATKQIIKVIEKGTVVGDKTVMFKPELIIRNSTSKPL